MKRCPFCGGTNMNEFVYPFQRPGMKGCYVSCKKCGAASGKYETIEEAVKAWDQRTYTGKHERGKEE